MNDEKKFATGGYPDPSKAIVYTGSPWQYLPKTSELVLIEETLVGESGFKETPWTIQGSFECRAEYYEPLKLPPFTAEEVTEMFLNTFRELRKDRD